MAEQNANAVAITGGTISGVTLPASNITGTLGVSNGGTGATTLTGYVKGTGTTAMTAAATIPNTDITGLGTASTKDAGAALGVATLDAGGKVPVSELPAAVLGALNYQGTWNASTNTPTLTSSVGTKGYYYVVNVAGSTDLNGITDWQVGDWAVFNGTAWQKVDNTDAGGDVVGPNSATDNAITRFDGVTGRVIQNSVVTVSDTGAATGFTTLAASTSVTTPIVQASNSGGLALKNSGGTTQMSVGAGGGDNMSINVSTNLNGTNAQIDISPTGTGHVHIKPTGVNSVEIAPTFVGEMDNITIGSITPAAGSFTNLSVTGTTSFDGAQGTAGQVLTSAGTGNTPTWTTPTTGTVTSVSGTAGRITSTGGNTPVIDLASGVATAGTTGSSSLIPVVTIDTYGRVTGITTAANPQGTVTSVAATVPTGLTVTGSPITSSGTLAITYTAGYAIPTTASQTNWDTAYTDRLKWDGGSTGLVAATGRTSLGGTTVGQNFFTLTNPSAITFPRMNADNTVSALDAASFRTAIGAGTGSGTVTSVSASVPAFLSITGSPITTSGTLAISYSGTALPVANGGTGATSAPAALTNLRGWTTTATAAGTTTLTNASTTQQEFTGTTTQTVVMPVTSTLALGWAFEIINNSTGSLTIQSSGLNTIATLTAGTTASVVCVAITGTTAASWDYDIDGFSTETGTGSVVRATSPTLVSPALGTPTALVGTNITGTASGLSIGGNAATVTNGVVTTGSYADPTWITSLAGSKITGTIDGGTF
jgi:hypothetical protein